MRRVKGIRQCGDGRVDEVLEYTEWTIEAPSKDEVLVEVLYSPIHPGTINVIEGNYGIKASLNSVPGNEGLGIVKEIGDAVHKLKVGDLVVRPKILGFWCEAFLAKEDQLFEVNSKLPKEQLAMLTVNPPSAYQMLHQFKSLQKGDWVIQNAANSAVGRWVIAICKHFGWKTINLVRRKELFEELYQEGADLVLLDEKGYYKKLEQKPVLGLNTVGGESCREMAKALERKGALVTYGAMSKQAIILDNGPVIFKELSLHGFWLSNVDAPPIDEAQIQLYLKLLENEHVHVPIAGSYPFSDFSKAIEASRQGERHGKVLFSTKSAER
jgi:trans-2-enoyl-CoA reductase